MKRFKGWLFIGPIFGGLGLETTTQKNLTVLHHFNVAEQLPQLPIKLQYHDQDAAGKSKNAESKSVQAYTMIR